MGNLCQEQFSSLVDFFDFVLFYTIVHSFVTFTRVGFLTMSEGLWNGLMITSPTSPCILPFVTSWPGQVLVERFPSQPPSIRADPWSNTQYCIRLQARKPPLS